MWSISYPFWHIFFKIYVSPHHLYWFRLWCMKYWREKRLGKLWNAPKKHLFPFHGSLVPGGRIVTQRLRYSQARMEWDCIKDVIVWAQEQGVHLIKSFVFYPIRRASSWEIRRRLYRAFRRQSFIHWSLPCLLFFNYSRPEIHTLCLLSPHPNRWESYRHRGGWMIKPWPFTCQGWVFRQTRCDRR